MKQKTKTMQLQGNDYAKVAERLKVFREENTNAKQESDHIEKEGIVIFTTWLWKNKNDLIDVMKTGVTDNVVLRATADSNGTAKGECKGKKDFEKLETIALGRALANLGYLASGEIASSEEMEEFNRYQQEKKEQLIENAVSELSKATTLAELQTIWKTLGTAIKEQEVVDKKEELKKILK